MSTSRTFIELVITASDLANVPNPRRFLVDTALIASIEDTGDSPFGRSYVTLFEASDETVESEAGEVVVRGAKRVLALDSYDEIRAKLAELGQVIRSQGADQSVLDAAKARARQIDGLEG